MGLRKIRRAAPSRDSERQARLETFLRWLSGGGGGSPEQVAARADRIVERIRAVNGNVLICSSGHFLRVLAARWLGLNRFTAETSCSPPQASPCRALRGNRVGLDLPVGGSVPVAACSRNRNYLDVVTESIFELSALSPLAVTFTPPSMASYVEVALVIGTRLELVSVSRCYIWRCRAYYWPPMRWWRWRASRKLCPELISFGKLPSALYYTQL